MTIAKDFASKFAVAFVAVAMIFMAIAPSVKAADSSADLQKTINDLLAQVAALQSQMGGTPTPAGLACGVFSMNLKSGSNGADVKNLQMFLNSNADTMVAATGAGSKGMETMTFGPLTATAVSKFQVKYRAEVLTPAGLVNGTGYFGPGSRAQANKLCAGAPTPTPGGTTPGSTDLSGEATLDKFTVDSPADDTIQEGAEDAPIAELTAKFKDGDAKISRLDVSFKPTTLGTKPWDVLDTVAVMVDGKQVGDSVNASNRRDYLDETNGTLRLTGLDIVAMQDKDADITIVATLQNGIDAADLGNVNVKVNAVRYFDAAGVAETDDATDDIGSDGQFSITTEAAGAQDELIAKTSSEDPNSTTFELKDDAKSGWMDVFAFDLDTKDSTNDITINTIKLNVATTGAMYSTLVDKAELEIDGTTYSDVTLTNGNLESLTFDTNGDAVINAGDRVTAVLKLRFKSLALGNEGSTIKASIASLDTNVVDAEGTDSLNNTQLSGAAVGDVHTLRTKGLSTDMTSGDAAVTVGQNALDDYATYTMKVDVTAFNQEVYVPTSAATALSYSLVDGAGVAAVAGTRSVTLTSTANEDTVGYFHVSEGETKTFTLKVTYTPGAANTAARLQLNSISFNKIAAVPNQTQTTLPATDYRTDVVTAVN